jgi:hypothetical protein
MISFVGMASTSAQVPLKGPFGTSSQPVFTNMLEQHEIGICTWCHARVR